MPGVFSLTGLTWALNSVKTKVVRVWHFHLYIFSCLPENCHSFSQALNYGDFPSPFPERLSKLFNIPCLQYISIISHLEIPGACGYYTFEEISLPWGSWHFWRSLHEGLRVCMWIRVSLFLVMMRNPSLPYLWFRRFSVICVSVNKQFQAIFDKSEWWLFTNKVNKNINNFHKLCWWSISYVGSHAGVSGL